MGLSPDEKTDLKEIITLTVKNAVLEGTKDIAVLQGVHNEKIISLEKSHDEIKSKVENNETVSQNNENTLNNFDKIAKKSGATWGSIISGSVIAIKLFIEWLVHYKVSGGN